MYTNYDFIFKSMDTKQILASWHCYPSKAVFIPKPNQGEEDDNFYTIKRTFLTCFGFQVPYFLLLLQNWKNSFLI